MKGNKIITLFLFNKCFAPNKFLRYLNIHVCVIQHECMLVVKEVRLSNFADNLKDCLDPTQTCCVSVGLYDRNLTGMR